MINAPNTNRAGRRGVGVADSEPMRRTQKPHLITDAERSLEEELRGREIRYVVMMSLRAVCVIVGAILVMVKAPLLPLWLVICVTGAVVLPWAAVLLANDRGPRPEHKLRNRFRPRTESPPDSRALTASEPEPHKIIDVEP